jgi:hypothetical protein
MLLLEIKKKFTKIGFGRKNQLSPQCVHTWAKDTGYTSINENNTLFSPSGDKPCQKSQSNILQD